MKQNILGGIGGLILGASVGAGNGIGITVAVAVISWGAYELYKDVKGK